MHRDDADRRLEVPPFSPVLTRVSTKPLPRAPISSTPTCRTNLRPHWVLQLPLKLWKSGLFFLFFLHAKDGTADSRVLALIRVREEGQKTRAITRRKLHKRSLYWDRESQVVEKTALNPPSPSDLNPTGIRVTGRAAGDEHYQVRLTNKDRKTFLKVWMGYNDAESSWLPPLLTICPTGAHAWALTPPPPPPIPRYAVINRC